MLIFNSNQRKPKFMSTTTNQVISLLAEVSAERVRQDEKWGGAEHDDHHSTADFASFIDNYLSKARAASENGNDAEARKRFIQVAALAVAGVESLDRKSVLVNL
jgi:hypothetical protein